MTIILRTIGFLSLFMAFISAVYDGMNSISSGNGIIFQSLGDQWLAIAPNSLDTFRSFITDFSQGFWDNFIEVLLTLPGWLFFVGLAIFCIIFSSVFGVRDKVNASSS